jgi:hypothetical protein
MNLILASLRGKNIRFAQIYFRNQFISDLLIALA